MSLTMYAGERCEWDEGQARRRHSCHKIYSRLPDCGGMLPRETEPGRGLFG
jgi:hypothetical protein